MDLGRGRTVRALLRLQGWGRDALQTLFPNGGAPSLISVTERHSSFGDAPRQGALSKLCISMFQIGNRPHLMWLHGLKFDIFCLVRVIRGESAGAAYGVTQGAMRGATSGFASKTFADYWAEESGLFTNRAALCRCLLRTFLRNVNGGYAHGRSSPRLLRSGLAAQVWCFDGEWAHVLLARGSD